MPTAAGSRCGRSTRRCSRGWPSGGSELLDLQARTARALRAEQVLGRARVRLLPVSGKRICGNSSSATSQDRVVNDVLIRREASAKSESPRTFSSKPLPKIVDGWSGYSQKGFMPMSVAGLLRQLPQDRLRASGVRRRVRSPIVPATAGDHAAIYCFLGEIFGGPSRAAFHGLAGQDPFYEPHDRLLLRRAGRIIGPRPPHAPRHAVRPGADPRGRPGLAGHRRQLPPAGAGHHLLAGRRAADGPLGRPGRPAADAGSRSSSAARGWALCGRHSSLRRRRPRRAGRGCWTAACDRAATAAAHPPLAAVGRGAA